MPSRKSRLNLTLDDELRDVIDRLSNLMEKPRAAIVNDFLMEMYPALVDLANALDAAKKQENVISHLAKMAGYANQQTAVINGEMADLYTKDSKK